MGEQVPSEAPDQSPSDEEPAHRFAGVCRVCGSAEEFELRVRSLREGFVCPNCRSHLRDQGQADALLRRYGSGQQSLSELVSDPAFRALDVYECGVPSHFKPYLQSLEGYVESTFWPDTEPGVIRNGVRCEDLMRLTLEDESFDIVITSDVFEHVRRPYVGFGEVERVLRTGGAHVFSIPVVDPMRPTTRARVDTSGAEDVFLVEPRYHNGKHLVYNDFGADLIGHLSELGFDTEIVPFSSPDPEASRLLTFLSVKVRPSRRGFASRVRRTTKRISRDVRRRARRVGAALASNER